MDERASVILMVFNIWEKSFVREDHEDEKFRWLSSLNVQIWLKSVTGSSGQVHQRFSLTKKKRDELGELKDVWDVMIMQREIKRSTTRGERHPNGMNDTCTNQLASLSHSLPSFPFSFSSLTLVGNNRHSYKREFQPDGNTLVPIKTRSKLGWGNH